MACRSSSSCSAPWPRRCSTWAHIRHRSKLIYVGLAAGCVAFALSLVLSAIENQPLDSALLKGAAVTGLWAVAAGFIMTGLLPFIEKIFGVLTDLSLLELGDVAHPLLQELVRRAPSTYNHSITVGSIAEAAAEGIGARGLLVRVGAYFHDIGKMLKPGYFVENQGSETSRHETLVPAMSTLVIIAHIKDGSDLARQHHLPQPIVDLIQQHHGTTLVEYFYDRAHGQKGDDSNGNEVDESIFRYPGPKPQTKEAAVLMLADAVESASRTLVDPTPARIESLVRGIAERRLHGGQFDESGLTLRELRTIERSLVMSLTAIYHGRLKYPEPRPGWREKRPREERDHDRHRQSTNASAGGSGANSPGRPRRRRRGNRRPRDNQRRRGRRRGHRQAQRAIPPSPRADRRAQLRSPRRGRCFGGGSGRQRETARRAAPRYGWSAEDELLLYVIHGALHLAGYDDAAPAERKVMRSREETYLQRVGVSRTK